MPSPKIKKELERDRQKEKARERERGKERYKVRERKKKVLYIDSDWLTAAEPCRLVDSCRAMQTRIKRYIIIIDDLRISKINAKLWNFEIYKK